MYFVSTRLDWIEIETVKEMLKKGYEFYVKRKGEEENSLLVFITRARAPPFLFVLREQQAIFH